MKQVYHKTQQDMPRIKGYFRIRLRYVHKAFIIKCLMLALAGVGVYFLLAHSILMQVYLRFSKIPTIAIDSPYLAEYQGKVRLTRKDGTIVYEGDIEQCIPQGTGKVYQEGVLIYEGTFVQGMYEGRGTLYSFSGNLLYTGEFSNNIYHGRGKLYTSDRQIYYEGMFENGIYEGTGELYYFRNGESYRYVGSFAAGVFSGEGKEYLGDTLVYEGGFLNGLYDGEGKLFEDGTLMYEGGFAAGKYHGEGKLVQQNLRYIGAFADGLFEGNGKLYEDKVLIYEGEFTEGKYSGSGTIFDKESGHKVFEGKFVDGERMEAGTAYDENGEAETLPLVFLNPLEYLGMAYEKVCKALEQAGIAYRPAAAIENQQLILTETDGFCYGFSSNGQGDNTDILSFLYAYQIAAIDNVIIGTDVSVLSGGESGEQKAAGATLSLTAQYVLALSNQFWGSEVAAQDIASITYPKSYGKLTVYYLPLLQEEIESQEETGKLEGKILFVEIAVS